jgi:hypothetical protein
MHHKRGYYDANVPSVILRKLCALDDAGERGPWPVLVICVPLWGHTGYFAQPAAGLRR